MWVELDIFSGRPNPRWVLSAAEEKSVTDLYENLPPGSGAAFPADAGLGYRGFRILDAQSALMAVVQGTAVQIREGSATTMSVRVDEDRQVERTLLQISRAHLSPETYAFLQSQLEG
jgi:hypothetical protein